MIYIFYLIFFGLFITAIAGLVASWIDRKVTARVQYRVGPPFLQPFIDIVKLFGKETFIPRGIRGLAFFMSPVIGFAGVILVSAFFWISTIKPGGGFGAGLIPAVFLLAIPSLSIIAGGFSSGGVYPRIGAKREMRLVAAYEVPFLLAIAVPVIKCGYSLGIGDILITQSQNGAVMTSLSGVLAFITALICQQANLGFVPFDMAEAGAEISGGALSEYSGALLGVYRLMRNMLLFTLPFFLMIMFMGGLRFDGIHFLYGILKYVGIVALITVIRNTNPRVRIDQAVRFFRGPMTIIAIIAVVLAVKGL